MTTVRREGLNHIREAVARHYEITVQEMIDTRNRRRETTEARRVAAILMDQRSDATWYEITSCLGFRTIGSLFQAKRDEDALSEAKRVFA